MPLPPERVDEQIAYKFRSAAIREPALTPNGRRVLGPGLYDGLPGPSISALNGLGRPLYEHNYEAIGLTPTVGCENILTATATPYVSLINN